MSIDLPFVSGTAQPPALPLGRYLPPVPAEMAANWLRQHGAAGEWVLDPLGSTPLLPLEAARAGYRVLVASNNPILTFLTETLAQAPTRAGFLNALADISAARRGTERLEFFFHSLYQTECAACRQIIQADAFLWKRGEQQPFARLYRCPHCGDEGERPLQPFDIERLSLPGNVHLHTARALERVALPGDPLREGAQEVLQSYLPRALLFITTLINRMEGLALPEPRRRLLTALALSVCDEANSLWPYPEARSRPRQLTIPPVFRENNLWAALQSAVESWCLPGAEVPVTHWPELPPSSGGICLYEGRVKALLPLATGLELRQLTAVLPRPNQAFWALSALWSGWLWGREAVQPLRNALERQRYDWHWHTQALYSVFSILPRELPFWGVMPELVPGFLSAAVMSADAAGWQLDGIALAAEEELAQLTWRGSLEIRSQSGQQAAELILQRGMTDHLRRSSEPASYLALHAAGLAALCAAGRISPGPSALSAEAHTRLQNSIALVLKASGKFIHFERQSSQNIETGRWWLAAPPAAGELPLADRVEMELVNALVKNPGCSFIDIQQTLNGLFPGLLTPTAELLQVCLESYASLSSGSPIPVWQLRPSESPAVRRADLDTIGRALVRLGRRLNFSVSGGMPVTWSDAQGQAVYLLFPLASAVISKHITQPQGLPPERCILVIPGSRVNLILYKLQRDPRLAEALGAGWRLLKFRQLREILDQPNLTQMLFESLIDGDPPRWEGATQPTMF